MGDLSSDESYRMSTKKILKNKTRDCRPHHPVASQKCRVETNTYLHVPLEAVQLIRMGVFNLKIN
jgi:hypothetical protein